MSAGCLLSAKKLATSPRENGRIRSLFAGVDSGRNGAVCTLRPTSRLPRLTPDFPRFRSGFCSWISFADLINRVRIPVVPPNMEGQTPYVYPCGRYQLTGRNRPIAVIGCSVKLPFGNQDFTTCRYDGSYPSIHTLSLRNSSRTSSRPWR